MVCLETEVLSELLCSLFVHLFKIRHQFFTARNHLEQPATRMKIFRVLFEVRGQLLNLLSEEHNLILWRTSIFIMPLKRSGYLFLLLIREGHSHIVSNGRVRYKIRLHRARIKISHEHNTMPPRFLQLLDFIGFSLYKNDVPIRGQRLKEFFQNDKK